MRQDIVFDDYLAITAKTNTSPTGWKKEGEMSRVQPSDREVERWRGGEK
ncbi:MAG: hypothetical protein P4L74_03095 [Candidatus Doudnabacteria bacterium]|nr:hypothetical protein [Candidatus Doudnabacteria bacterium]